MTLAALGFQTSSHALVLPVCRGDVAVFHDGRGFSLPMASIAGQDDSEVVVRRLVKTLVGMQDVAVSYVGACGGVELWRVDVAEEMPRPTLLVEGLQWKPTGDIQRKEHWRRAHFDPLRLFGVLPLGEADRVRLG
jgi:hypothetical protein